VQLANGARLIDDSYNASPAAVHAMVLALAATPTAGRRIAVLGQMLELGVRSEALHEACGRAAALAGVDVLIAIGGPDSEALARGALAAGLSASHVQRFQDSVTAARAVVGIARTGDIVLVKGSRGTRTDIVADRLREVA
jgi:UDP-N-acetylmuramoyl-tripeptide--D-alanyl-D-alanine ligase